MQIFDTGNKTDKVDMNYVPWPGEGYFPDDFFSGGQAWSVSLNPKVYDISKCQPGVTLSNVTTGQKWVFSDADKNTSTRGKYFIFDRGGYGWAGCIIFRPDDLDTITNSTFAVTITGLVEKDGTPGSINYEVTFFTL
jgi:hypothetical protein